MAEENVERSGILLSDEAVLRAMEADLEGRYIPVTMEKDGIRGKSAVTGGEMEALEREMCASIARIGGEMSRGEAQARPQVIHGKDPCQWCKMKPVCRRGGAEKEDV